ncbi:DUF5134 domain-containing protein [Streptomyces ureilyticus]|uniref:DUF5134 domain-containing protein n=1 Tax=Streptomyces ureilyticus TaxID=1775131 RepID=A0ABX0DU48_9ACTN|nr:DUF5134 domain-containing protein [Streptomyces ureilyticus]NGO42676.1 DUF5134 domain-containing protein [Streptomyces ureilyticus]
MGILALTWSIAVLAGLVAAVSSVRMVTSRGGARFAAGGDLLMSVCMAAMSLPLTVSWYAEYGMGWAVVFALLGLAGVALAVKHTREGGWRHGGHWVRLIVGSAGVVIMTLAMTSTSSGPVLALGGSHMAHMPGMEHMAAGSESAGHSHTEAMDGHGHGSVVEGHGHGTESSDLAAAGDVGASASSGAAVWRLVVVVLAVCFLLSIAASMWAQVRDANPSHRLAEGRAGSRRHNWSRWLLAMPDTVVVFLASLTLAVRDRARTVKGGTHRRRPGAAPEAALAAHVGMGGTMAAMLLLMAV